MKLAVATWPDEPRTKDSKTAATGLAVILVVMLVAQLFRLDNFIPLLDSFNVPGMSGRVVAVILTLSSLFALPFLLRMRLSLGFRWLSMLAGWLVVLGWFSLALWLNLSQVGALNAGLLGSEVFLIPGWWLVFVTAGLGVLAAWSSWGLWPSQRARVESVEQAVVETGKKPVKPVKSVKTVAKKAKAKSATAKRPSATVEKSKK